MKALYDADGIADDETLTRRAVRMAERKAKARQAAPAGVLGTREVAELLGVDEQRVQTVLRTTPGLRPALVSGRRVWRPEEVELLRQRLAELEARRARRG